MRRIFIAENIPSLNKGEMTILDGMLESFRCLGRVNVSVLSANPILDQPRYNDKVKIVDIAKYLPNHTRSSGAQYVAKFFPSVLFIAQHLIFLFLYKIFGSIALQIMKSELWQEYVKADVIILGHDGTFGIGGNVGQLFVFYHFFLPVFAKALCKPVVFYGGTIHKGGRFRWLIGMGYKFALGKMDLITLRERVSYQNFMALGLHDDGLYVTADPAFLLKPASLEQVTNIMKKEGIGGNTDMLIGLTVTRLRAELAFPAPYNPQSSYNRHIDMLAEVIDNLTQTHGATVIVVPHCIGYGDKLDDRLVANDILQRCRNKDKVIVITSEYSAAELKGLIGQFDFFIGERLHSAINAMSMGVPSIVISNQIDQRLDIIRMLGQDDAICYVENLDSETLLARINDFCSKRNHIKEQLKAQTEIIVERAMLNGKLLKELLSVVKQR